MKPTAVLWVLLALTISMATAQPAFLNYSCANGISADSILMTNLDTLLSSLTSKEMDYGFYSSSYGENPDIVNAIGWCRGDVKQDDCRSCLRNSITLLPNQCPNQTEAIGWYDTCMLRYSNRSIFGLMETSPSFSTKNVYDAPALDQFNRVLLNLLHKLTDVVGSGDLRRKFAAGNVPGPDYQTIYALVQCTPDLAEQDCQNCLTKDISAITQSCGGKIGCRVDGPSCSFRYEIVRFYDPEVDTPPAQPPATLIAPPPYNDNTLKKGKNSKSKVIATVVAVVAVVILTIAVVYLKVRRRKENPDGVPRKDNIEQINRN